MLLKQMHFTLYQGRGTYYIIGRLYRLEEGRGSIVTQEKVRMSEYSDILKRLRTMLFMSSI